MRKQVRVWAAGAATAAVLLGVEVALAAAARWQGRRVLAPGPASLDEVVGAGAALVALLLGAWLAISATTAVLAHAPGRIGTRADRLAASWAPLLTRRVAAALVGAAIGSTLGPATALAHESSPAPVFSVSAPAHRPQTPAPGWTTSLPAAGWTPSRPVQRAVVTPDLVASGTGSVGPAAPTAPPAPREVVVHRGDTLWDLVSSHLGPEASDAEVAAAWPRWHEANLAVIGDNPDRLLPGQVLRVPTSVMAR